MGETNLDIIGKRQLGKSLREDIGVIDGLKGELAKRIRAEAHTRGEKIAAGLIARKFVLVVCGKVVRRWHPEVKEYQPTRGNPQLGAGGGITPNWSSIGAEAGKNYKTIALWEDTVREVEKAGGENAYLEAKLGELIDRWERGMLRETYTETPDLPVGKFRILYADPPWEYDNSGFDQSAAAHYQTMSTDRICALGVKDKATDDSVLFLWATNAFLEDALRVCKAWGFIYKTNFAWIKDKGPSMGWFSRSRHELLLVAVRGNILHPEYKPISWFRGESSKHSKKPDQTRGMIELMYPVGPYIELFSREKHDNWEAWGNECS